jgi:ankyrin repeat protein
MCVQQYGQLPLFWLLKTPNKIKLDYSASDRLKMRTCRKWAPFSIHWLRLWQLYRAAGATVNFTREEDDATPLYAAALEGHLDTVQLLLAYGMSDLYLFRCRCAAI